MYKQLMLNKKISVLTIKLLMKIQVHISSFRQLCGRNRSFPVSNTCTYMHILLLLFILLLFKHMCRAHCQQMFTSVANPLPYETNMAINSRLKNPSTSSPSSALYLRPNNNIYYGPISSSLQNKSAVEKLGISSPKVKNQSVFDDDNIINIKTVKNQKVKIMRNYKIINSKFLTNITNLYSDNNKNKSKQQYLREIKNSSSNETYDLRAQLKHNGAETKEVKKFLNLEDKQNLLRLVMNGLGLQELPDMKKINISQAEYVSKYNEYLQRIQKKQEIEFNNINHNNLTYNTISTPEKRVISFWSNNVSQDNINESWPNQRRKREYTKNLKHNKNSPKDRRNKNQRRTTFLHFSLNTLNKSIKTEGIEEANLRLLLIYNPALTKRHQKNKKIENLCNRTAEKSNHNNKIHTLNIKIYQRLTRGKRLWLDERKIDINIAKTNLDNTQSRWVQFDVTRAVEMCLKENQLNLAIELHCDRCVKAGARILSDISSSNEYSTNTEDKLVPVVNIITRPGQKETIKNELFTEKEYDDNATDNNSRIIGGSCEQSKSKNPRCCRHPMQVVFSQIKGFEFIIQPKIFDAGYCFGRCPIRYNPAHHHAMLQGLIWKQSNGLEAPRPCCAPSKLVELEVLHVDEKNSDKLKISTWTDMRVVECACS